MPEETFVAADAAQDTPVYWKPLTRLSFRFAFCYFMIYALCCGNATIWEVIPFHVGEFLENWLSWPFAHAGQYLAQHMFHVQGIGAKLHDTGSGDTAIAWIAVGVMLVTAIVATLVWTALDRKSRNYRKLYFWFRFTLRLTLGYSMLNYGLAKVFPLQMPPPSLAVLNEPFGNLSPMTLLWSTIGLNPVYEMICGATEVLAGLLILFRRTALLGALFTAFVVSNVVLYNYFFDVPVKLYATHLLLMALVYVVPDMRSLFRYFILHKPTAPSGGWMRPARRYGMRVETIVTAVMVALVVLLTGIDLGQAVHRQHETALHPSPFMGIWHVDSASKPFVTGDGVPLADIIVEKTGRAMLRSADTVLWRGGVHYDDKKHTMRVGCAGHDSSEYAVTQTDPMHLTLTPTGKDAANNGVLQLTRVPLPTHYPLEERGFHWINEWGLER